MLWSGNINDDLFLPHIQCLPYTWTWLVFKTNLQLLGKFKLFGSSMFKQTFSISPNWKFSLNSAFWLLIWLCIGLTFADVWAYFDYSFAFFPCALFLCCNLCCWWLCPICWICFYLPNWYWYCAVLTLLTGLSIVHIWDLILGVRAGRFSSIQSLALLKTQCSWFWCATGFLLTCFCLDSLEKGKLHLVKCQACLPVKEGELGSIGCVWKP